MSLINTCIQKLCLDKIDRHISGGTYQREEHEAEATNILPQVGHYKFCSACRGLHFFGALCNNSTVIAVT